jgi:2-alkyl-3-oxoalkanoate reductase
VDALVTGAGGFLGLAIVQQLLARGERVRALCRRRSTELDALGVDAVPADLRVREEVVAACEGADVVFHAAAVVGASGPWDRYCATNYWGTRYIVDGCLKHAVGRLVFTSCASVTFQGGDQRGVDDSVPYPRRWLGNCVHTKAMAERQVLAANGLEGLLTCVLRPPIVWGPRDRHFLPWLLATARAGRLRRIGNGTNLIDTVYVENLAEAHLLAADALLRGAADSGPTASGHTYFVTQGEPVNCWDWIDELLALHRLPRLAKTISFQNAWRFGGMHDLFARIVRRKTDPPLSRLQAVQLGRSHCLDMTAARRDLCYSPRVSTAAGMQRLWNPTR